MNSLRYLNTVLTMIAILLAVHAWAIFIGTDNTAPTTSPWVSEAQAAGKTPTGGGIPNAGAQRQQMVDMLKRISQQNESMANLFRTGQARVRLEGVNTDTNKRD